MTRKPILSILLLSILTLVACGGSGKPTPGQPGSPAPAPTAQSAGISISQVRGMHVQAAQTTTKTTSSLVWGSFFSLPKVEASTVTTVNVNQNWEGECSGSPMVGVPSSFVVFGIGQSQQLNISCADEEFENDLDGSLAANGAGSGKRVWGNGTLGNLVVATEKGTVIASPNGVLVSVFIQRGGTLVATGITCSLPQGTDEQSCASTTTFAALNGDKVVAVITLGNGDALVNTSVAFTKAL